VAQAGGRSWQIRAIGKLKEGGEVMDMMDRLAELSRLREPLQTRIKELEEKLQDFTWRVVANAGQLSKERKPRWSHVSDATANGSTVSAELCKSAGFDPDEGCGGNE
jgi:predicted transcriptional regulator